MQPTYLHRSAFGLAIVFATLAVGTGSGAAQSRPTTAVATVRDARGNPLGTATFRQVEDGVTVEADLVGVPGSAGMHGIHLHQFGLCDPPGFATAGGHYNPTQRQHGLLNPNGPHIGDLQNLDNPAAGSSVEVTAAGTARVRALASDASVGPGAEALLDSDGAALVLHMDPDDNRTSPSGHSGDRLACGVLEPASASS